MAALRTEFGPLRAAVEPSVARDKTLSLSVVIGAGGETRRAPVMTA